MARQWWINENIEDPLDISPEMKCIGYLSTKHLVKSPIFMTVAAKKPALLA